MMPICEPKIDGKCVQKCEEMESKKNKSNPLSRPAKMSQPPTKFLGSPTTSVRAQKPSVKTSHIQVCN